MLFSFFSLITQAGKGATEDVPLGGFTPPTDAYSEGSDVGTGALTNLELFVSNIIGFLTALGALFFVVQFVIGAFQWISSEGDKGKLEKARNQMVHGALGMIIIIASYSIIGLLGSLLGFDFLNPAEQIQNIIAPVSGGL
ncbi:MAG: hypothetical protein A2383_00490 [Candidatus Pacebacteria bacterium RIFOXYB1_FULL_39_46]|nr:MAG: hypothetical protein A2182_00320 [Candidatus Pacebacteria bacterium RIFOXYA1_FULL_38_18]OGJ38066.1 MAG: hypothetical protein A2383_00490 [Candidatus Pacebacteria bacterium RIFOXYB1_FULL_39_46]OGJ39711.1 MAG: hypothetical protein A2411_02955 [Candidatus Pacebacteria bacterium RIFOXYC1_FULL_39_21]OGJ39818.1 MAG: hypothetical protein A2582_00255 [Candidatus Pacebacteria bacterium RIFOXYD1_FULL_39_27]